MYDELLDGSFGNGSWTENWPTVREMEFMKAPLRPVAERLIALREEDLAEAIADLWQVRCCDFIFIADLLVDKVLSRAKRSHHKAATILSRCGWFGTSAILIRIGRSKGGPGAIRLAKILPLFFPSLDDLELAALHVHLMGFFSKKDRPALANAGFEIWVQLEKFLLQNQRDLAMRLVATRLAIWSLKVTDNNLAEARQLVANTGSRIVSAICSGSEAPPTPRYRKGEQ